MRTLLEMARAAQHDDRQSTGKLYGDLADRVEALEAVLEIFATYANVHDLAELEQIALSVLRRK
jgi:hypothetical protein